MRLVGERVVLRPFRDDEHDVMWQWALDAMPSMTEGDGARGRFEERLRASGQWTEHELRLAVEGDGELVGDIQARRSFHVMPPGLFELGLELFKEAQGKGYGPEAVRLITARLFEDEGAHRVQLSTEVGNRPMRVVAERLGFGYEGVLRGYWPGEDGRHPQDYAMYGMTKDDYEGRKRTWTRTS